MEKVLIRREEYASEIEMLHVEKTLKMKRFNAKNNRKRFTEESMEE